MADDEVTAALEEIRAIGSATEHPEGACWLCRGLGGIAIHLKWSAERGEGKLPLWTAHEYPSDDPHPVEPCPACTLALSVAAIEAVLKEARRMEVSGGGPIPMIHKRAAARKIREVITRELTGKEEPGA